MSKVPEWFYNQAGIIPYTIEDKRLRILLIKSRKGRHWIIPKGIIEPGLQPYEAAVMEALEEAGIIGDIDKAALGTYTYEKWGGVCTVKVYPLLVGTLLEKWEEDFRKRKWFKISSVKNKLEEKELFKLVGVLVDRLRLTYPSLNTNDGE